VNHAVSLYVVIVVDVVVDGCLNYKLGGHDDNERERENNETNDNSVDEV
jgi:hypothetical protein